MIEFYFLPFIIFPKPLLINRSPILWVEGRSCYSLGNKIANNIDVAPGVRWESEHPRNTTMINLDLICDEHRLLEKRFNQLILFQTFTIHNRSLRSLKYSSRSLSTLNTIGFPDKLLICGAWNRWFWLLAPTLYHGVTWAWNFFNILKKELDFQNKLP